MTKFERMNTEEINDVKRITRRCFELFLVEEQLETQIICNVAISILATLISSEALDKERTLKNICKALKETVDHGQKEFVSYGKH